MEIKFLGTGGAFDYEKGTSAALIDVAGKTILIDAGFSTILKMAEKDLFEKIDYILITHLHNDHVGSLPTLLAHYKHKLGVDMPPIIVPNEKFKAELQQLINIPTGVDWGTYVSITEFPEIGFIDTTGQHVPGMTSYAYYFIEDDSLIYYSGDIANADTAKDFLADRTESKITVFHETAFFKKSDVHTPYIEIQEKLDDYELYAYHIDKANKPDDCTLTLVEEVPELMV